MKKKVFFSFNKNSSQCTSRYVDCSFDSPDDFFHRMSGKSLLHFERSHTNGIFPKKRISNFFPEQLKRFLNKWLKLVDQNSENNQSIPKKNVRLEFFQEKILKMYLWARRRTVEDISEGFSTKMRKF